MQMGGSSPETFVSILRLQNASLPRAEKSLALASAQGGRCGSKANGVIIWPTGNAARQDVLATMDMEEAATAQPGNDDFEA